MTRVRLELITAIALRLLTTLRDAQKILARVVPHFKPQWVDHWFLEKPELIPLHLTWIFTAILAIFAVQAWRDAKEAGEKTTAQLNLIRAEQRSWLDVKPDDILRPYVICKNKSNLYILEIPAEIHNVGKTPAFEVPNEVTGSVDTGDIDSQNCDTTIVRTSSTVLPDQKTSIRTLFSISPLTVALMRKNAREEGVEACIPYQIIEGDKAQYDESSTHRTSVDVRFVIQPTGIGNTPQFPAGCESVRLTVYRINFAD